MPFKPLFLTCLFYLAIANELSTRIEEIQLTETLISLLQQKKDLLRNQTLPEVFQPSSAHVDYFQSLGQTVD